MTDIDKFNYLHSLLEHAAAEAIAGLTLSSSNYEEAIVLLKKRFGCKQQLISKHMEALLNLEAVTWSRELKNLRQLYDKVESHVRCLKSLDITSASYGSLLSSILMKKIPQDLCLIVSREIVRDEWDLDSLMKVIEKEIEARERAAVDSSVNTRKPSREPPTTSALLTNNPQIACCYCNGSHQSHLCRTVPSAEQRKQCLMRSGRCFICLRKGHRVKDCRSSLRCFSCQARHHVSICTVSRSELGVREQQPTQTAVTTSTQPNPPTTQNMRASQPPVLSMYVATRTPVLLQTAKAQVFRQDRPSSTVNTRIIFDSGSQRSYIVSRVRDLLALPTEMTERVLIKTFGSKVEKVQVCDVVNLAIKTKNGMSLVVSLLTVPMVCEPLSGQPLNLASEHFPYLAGLELADSSSLEDNLDIGILIGADQYWKLVTGKIRQEGTGPIAVETKLGWVLSGPVPGVSHGGTSVNFVSTHVLKVECSDCDLDTTLKAFWDLDTLGSRASKTTNPLFTKISYKLLTSRMVGIVSIFRGKGCILCCRTTLNSVKRGC